MLNVIKEYLVSLGYSVDQQSYNTARRSMDEMGRVVERFADSSALKFAATSAAIMGFVTTAVAAVHQFTVGVAQADLQNEIFARQMWMSKDAAVSYQKSLDALGASLQDLYLSPELMEKFIELRKQAQELETPGGFDEAMRGVRDITFEFQRLKLEGSYAVYWIGYYLTKYLSGPLGNTRDGLKNINDIITEKMPYWTKNVAQVLSWFARLGSAAYLVGKEIKETWDSLGDSTKQVIGITAGFFMLLRMGPLGWVIAALTTLLLLIDDFATYERGGQSAFPKLWEWLDELKDKANDNGDLQKLKQDIDDLAASLKDLARELGNLFKVLTGEGIGEALQNGIILELKAMDLYVKSISTGLKVIKDIVTWLRTGDNSGPKDYLKDFKEYLETKGPGRAIAEWLNDQLIKNGWVKNPASKSPTSYGAPTNSGTQNNNNQNIAYNPAFAFTDPFSRFSLAAVMNAQRPSVVTVSTEIKPNYYIYGATNPQGVVEAVDRTNINLLTRSLQGVEV